jgi:V/A-type H+-transporting ATPase subunit K
MSFGLLLAIIGAALAAILAGLGSVFGVQIAGKAATGVVSEKPDLFGKLLVLQALPGTQGIYGFLVAVLVLVRTGLLGGGAVALTPEVGWAFFGACMPIAIVGLISAIYQGKMAAYSILMTAKQPDASVKGMTMTALVETYAILALLISILFVFGIQVA